MRQALLRSGAPAPDNQLPLPDDAVVVCAGGQLPTPLLQKVGIRFDTRFGTA